MILLFAERLSILSPVIILSLLFVLGVVGWSVYADPLPTVQVQIPEDEYDVGDEFGLQVKAEDVQDMYAAEVTVNYDTDLLSADEVTPGEWVPPEDESFQIIKEKPGELQYVVTLTGDDEPKSGDLTLLTADFHAVYAGEAEFTDDRDAVNNVQVKLLDADDEQIDHEFDGTEVSISARMLLVKVEGEGEVIPPAGEHHSVPEIDMMLVGEPEEGWTFSEWTGDVDAIDDPKSKETEIRMDDDREVTAVFREISDDATLQHLEVQPGELGPDFESGVTEYDADVAYDVEQVDVTATLSCEFASLEIAGESVASGETKSVDLGPDGTDIEIEVHVVADDEETEKTYTVTVHREQEPEHATIDPTEAEFDLYEPEDVETTITWNDAEEVEDVTGEGIGGADWSEDADVLTIYQDFLEGFSEDDELQFTVEFDVGDDAVLLVDVVDTEPPPDPPPPPPVEYTLTIEKEGEGTVEPEPGEYTYEEDEEVTVEATPDAPGYMFSHWEIDGEEVEVDEPPLTIDVEMDESKTVTAVFAEPPVVLPYVSETLDPEEGGVLEVEDLITVTVPPAALEYETEVGVQITEVDPDEVCPPRGPVDGIMFELSAYEFANDEAEPLDEFYDKVEVQLHWEEELDTEDAERILTHYRHILLQQLIPLPTEVDVTNQWVASEIEQVTDLVMCIKDKFTDIDAHWGERYILLLTEYGAIEGYPDFTFRPDELVTREEFATMLVETADVEVPERARMLPVLMDDADEVSEWARPYVDVALTERLIEGYDDDTFRPHESVTRDQVATMLSRSLGLTPVNDPPFADAHDIPDWAEGHVAALEGLDIIEGYRVNDEYYFRPHVRTTRAEVAAFLTRYLEERLRRQMD